MFKKVQITVYIVLAIITSLFFYSVFIFVPDSKIAQKIDLKTFSSAKVADLIPGEWDVVCTVIEMMNPSEVVSELGYSDFSFVEFGNKYQNIILDGQSGVVVINRKTKEYALFLIFDRDRVAFLSASATGHYKRCHEFSKTMVVKSKISDTEWLYVRLEDER